MRLATSAPFVANIILRVLLERVKVLLAHWRRTVLKKEKAQVPRCRVNVEFSDPRKFHLWVHAGNRARVPILVCAALVVRFI